MSKINQNYILPQQEKGEDPLKDDPAYNPWADKMYEQDREFQELDSSLKNESHKQEHENAHKQA